MAKQSARPATKAAARQSAKPATKPPATQSAKQAATKPTSRRTSKQATSQRTAAQAPAPAPAPKPKRPRLSDLDPVTRRMETSVGARRTVITLAAVGLATVLVAGATGVRAVLRPSLDPRDLETAIEDQLARQGRGPEDLGQAFACPTDRRYGPGDTVSCWLESSGGAGQAPFEEMKFRIAVENDQWHFELVD